jgi:hypothetical protein
LTALEESISCKNAGLEDYTSRLCGAITVTPIAASFSSPPTTFAAVGPLDRYQIPVDAPDGAWA